VGEEWGLKMTIYKGGGKDSRDLLGDTMCGPPEYRWMLIARRAYKEFVPWMTRMEWRRGMVAMGISG